MKNICSYYYTFTLDMNNIVINNICMREDFLVIRFFKTYMFIMKMFKQLCPSFPPTVKNS